MAHPVLRTNSDNVPEQHYNSNRYHGHIDFFSVMQKLNSCTQFRQTLRFKKLPIQRSQSSLYGGRFQIALSIKNKFFCMV